MCTYTLYGNYKENTELIAANFILVDLKLAENSRIIYEEDSKDCLLQHNEKKFCSLEELVNSLFNEKIDYTNEIKQLINLAINDKYNYTDSSIDIVNKYLANVGENFLVDDKLHTCDYIIVSAIENWNNTASMDKRKANRFALRYLSKVKKYVKNTKDTKNTNVVKQIERPLDDPTRWKLVVGKIIDIWENNQSDKLYCEKIDIGEEKPRLIGTGLRKYIVKEDLLNRKVIVLANMKPKNLAGFVSHGMILCASDENHTRFEVLFIDDTIPEGTRITFEGLEGEPDLLLTTKANNNTLEAVKMYLKTDNEGIVNVKGHKMNINGNYIKATTIKNGVVS